MNIVVYDDSPDFGGHQVMACHGIAALAQNPTLKTTVIFNSSNRQLADRLHAIENLNFIEVPYSTHRLQGALNRISHYRIHTLERFFRSLNPDLILCIQGNIEQSSQAVLAARKAKIECVSYIAIPHGMADMGAKLGTLRDRMNRYLFNQPSRYIAISDSMSGKLRKHGVEKPITVVQNGIPTPSASHSPNQKPHVALGMLGRIEFKQKCQDFMVQTFCDYPEVFADCSLVIAGEGPDECKLKELINRCSRKADISVLPWQDEIDAFFANINFLMLPSRYEGVPLVMLEALARGIPVLGSRCDGMLDILPKAWTYESGNAKALANAFLEVKKSHEKETTTLQQHVLTEMSLNHFRENFIRAVIEK